MARTAKEIQEQIDKLEAARKVTKARNGYRHYTDRINYLRGELALQKAKEEEVHNGRPYKRCQSCSYSTPAREHYCSWCGATEPADPTLQQAHEQKGADDMTRQTAAVWAAYGREWIKEI